MEQSGLSDAMEKSYRASHLGSYPVGMLCKGCLFQNTVVTQNCAKNW
jgi:hypothetical protein